jgi:hypothetical protein
MLGNEARLNKTKEPLNLTLTRWLKRFVREKGDTQFSHDSLDLSLILAIVPMLLVVRLTVANNLKLPTVVGVDTSW